MPDGFIPGYNEFVRWAECVCDLLAPHGDRSTGNDINEAIRLFEENKFRLTIMGMVKRGKSTLVNSLLGRRDDVVAPIDKLPASSIITEVGWAETENATVHFRDGHHEQIAFARIKEFATEEFNSRNSKGVSRIGVAGPFAGLSHDVVLVDTPGKGSLHEHHDHILHAFIPQSDAVIFLVTASLPLVEEELELLRKVTAADIKKIFFVMNKVDASDPRDIEQGLTHTRSALEHLGVQIDEIHKISAVYAFRGDLGASGSND